MAAIIFWNFGDLDTQLLSTCRRQSVVAGAAVGLGLLPLCLHPALQQQTLKGGIQGALFHREHIVRYAPERLRDAVAVQRGALEGLQD